MPARVTASRPSKWASLLSGKTRVKPPGAVSKRGAGSGALDAQAAGAGDRPRSPKRYGISRSGRKSGAGCGDKSVRHWHISPQTLRPRCHHCQCAPGPRHLETVFSKAARLTCDHSVIATGSRTANGLYVLYGRLVLSTLGASAFLASTEAGADLTIVARRISIRGRVRRRRHLHASGRTARPQVWC